MPPVAIKHSRKCWASSYTNMNELPKRSNRLQFKDLFNN